MPLPPWLPTALTIVFLVTFVVATTLAFLSLLAIVPIEQPIKGTLWGLCITQVVGLVLRWQKGGFLPRTEKHFRDPKKINPYLNRFISGGSDIVIFSNTFSWVNKELQGILRAKADGGQSVTLYAPKANKKINYLERNFGVTVINYSSLKIMPRVRFTLLDRNRAGAERLAIGQGDPTNFRISEFTSGRDPQVVAMASMLVELVDKHNESTIRQKSKRP